MTYTKEEIKLLWDNLELCVPFNGRDICPVDTILIMIYTGMRPEELLKVKNEDIHLEERYIMVCDSKNGSKRIVPIHEDIYPLIKKRKETTGKYFFEYETDTPPTLQQYRSQCFKPIMLKLDIKHTLQESRHTFIEMANKYIMQPNEITGFAVRNSKTPEELVKEINKIEFVKRNK